MPSTPPPPSQQPLLAPSQDNLDRTGPSPPSQDARSVSSAEDSTTEKNKAVPSASRPHWIPLALKRWVFVALALLFVAFFVVIEVLFQYSNKNDGISTNSSTNHYLWTYGPTAVFILVSAVWGQIEYRTKQLMPWAAMDSSAETPRKSILLDYISLWNVVVLFKAGRSRHWPVVIVILGTLLLQLITVASTGLLTLEKVKLDHIDTTPVAQSVFDATKFSTDDNDGRAAYTTVGIGWLELAYPLGTSAEHAFQPFNVSHDVATSVDSLIRADVDVFTPQLDCEWGTVVDNLTLCADRACVTTVMELTITTDSCDGAYLAMLRNEQAGARGYFGDVQHLTCNDTAAGDDADRLMFITAHWVSTEKTDKLQALSCRPTYTMTRQQVTINTAGAAQAFQPSNSSTPPAQLTTRNASSLPAMDLADGVLNALEESRTPFVLLTTPATQDMQGQHFQAFFRVANLTAPHTGDEWLDRDIMQRGVTQTFETLMIQTARQQLMQPASVPLTGFLSATRSRLIVRELSVRLMESSLVVLIVICAGMWFLRPVYSTPRDPGSIMGQIIVLDRSLELAQTVAGIMTEKKLARATHGKVYKGSMTPGLDDTPIWRVQELPALADQDNQAPEVADAKKKAKPDKPPSSWQPWTLTLFGRSLALASPLLLIIGLELVYQLSHRWDGLGTVGANQYIEYTWVYVPAALMMAVRIIYEGIFSSAKIFQPYLHLRRGTRIEDDAITDNPQAKLAVQSLFKALAGHFGVAPTALATLLAPLLTIVASGLYAVEDIRDARPVSIHRTDLFNNSIHETPPLLTTAESNLVGGLIVTAGVAYPDWTYDELTLAALQPGSLRSADSNTYFNTSSTDNNGTSFSLSTPSTNNTNFLHLDLPALRVNLDCAPLPPSGNLSLRPSTDDTLMLYLNAGDGCGLMTDNRTDSITLPGRAQPGRYFGSYNSMGRHETDCADVLLAFGYLPDTQSTEHLHAYACRTSIDSLLADTTILLPNYTISAAHPIESTAHRFIDSYETYDDIGLFLPTRNDSAAAFDQLFSAITDPSRGVTTSDLVDHPDKVVRMAQHVYRVLMAQTMSVQARMPLSDAPGVDTVLNGSFVDPNVTRLKQSPVSSRILEGLLATMWIACVVAFHFLRTRDLLPLNPCSIAGAATYLARSQLVGEGMIPAGAEVQRKADLLMDGRLKGLMLSLGWWSDDQGRRYGVDIGKAD